MIDFMRDNWPTILISTFFFLLSIPIMFWRARTVRRERRSKARELLIDASERRLAQENGLSLSLLEELIRAAELEYDVPLRGSYDVDDLLRDLVLRASKSAYLSPEALEVHTAELQALLAEYRPGTPEVTDDEDALENSPAYLYERVRNLLWQIFEYQRPTDFAKVLVSIALIASLTAGVAGLFDSIQQEREAARLETELDALRTRNEELRSRVESLSVPSQLESAP